MPVAEVASADGTPIAFRASGTGEPLLLVHGTGTWGGDWAFVLPFLRERFSVVSMDRRGRGRSGDGAEYAMEREAEDVLAVLDAVDGELLVGHSYGALCSILAAVRSERLRRLVLYEPPIAVQRQWAVGLEELVREGSREQAIASFLRGAGASDEQLTAIRSSPAWPALVDTAPTLPRELSAAADWRHPTGPIEVPTLMLTGADTRSSAYLDGLEDLLAAFAEVRHEYIPGQQHVAHVFAAEAFARLVADFCTARPGRT